MTSTSSLSLFTTLLACVVLSGALGCDAGRGIGVQGRIVGEGTLSAGPDGETVQGTARLTLAVEGGDGEAIDATVLGASAFIDGFDTELTIDDASPIHLLPGQSTDVGFHFEGARTAGPRPGPWGLACDAVTPKAAEHFPLSARVFDSTMDGSFRQDAGNFDGTLTLRHDGAPPDPPPSALVGAAWSRRFGGAGDDSVSGLAVDAAGNVLVSGKSEQGVDFGQGSVLAPTFLAKLSPAGEVLYARPIASRPGLSQVAAGGDVEIVAGTFTDEVVVGGEALPAPLVAGAYVARVDEAGEALWVRSWAGAAAIHVSSVAVSPMGEVVVAGILEGAEPIDLGGGPLDGETARSMFLLGLDASGNHVFSRRFYRVSSVDSMTVDASGAIVVAGTGFEQVDFGGGAVPIEPGGDAWVVKLDATGAHLWSQVVSWAHGPQVPRVATNADGVLLVVAGYSVAELDEAGVPMWARDVLGVYQPEGVALDDDGRIFLSATFKEAIDIEDVQLLAGTNMVRDLVTLRADGTFENATPFACDVGAAMLHHRIGLPGVALAAGFHSVAALDQGPLQGVGREDVVVAFLAP